MTLGSTPTITEILDEIQESLPYTFPTDKTRWLADVGASDPFTIPTDFANKISCKVVGEGTGLEAGKTITFSGVDFGNAFTGRVLIACIGLRSSGEKVLNQSSCTIGGVSATGGNAGWKQAGGPSCGGGLWAAAVPTGTSGDVVINWTGDSGAGGGLILLSTTGISTTADFDNDNWFGYNTGAATTLDIPSNGLLVVSVAHSNSNDTTLSGVTEQYEITFDTNGRLCVGFDNRMDSETGRSITPSWTGTTSWGGEARSFTQS